MKSLGLALTALSHRTDDAVANAADARKAADAAAKAVADLQTSIAAAAASGAPARRSAEFEALQKRVAALETQAKSRARDPRQEQRQRQCRAACLERAGPAQRRQRRRALRG